MKDPNTAHPVAAPAPAPAPAKTARRARPFRLLVGALLALLGTPLLLGGLGLGWALATQRDDDGFFTTPIESISTSTVALATTQLDFGDPGPDSWWADLELATVRLGATSTGDVPVFLGIAPTDAVADYIGATPYEEVSEISSDPVRYTLTRRGGDATLTEPPTDQTFWTAQTSGVGTQELTWDLETGTYTVVIMNADGSAGVDVDVNAGGRLDALAPLSGGLVIGGLVLVVGGALLMVYGVGTSATGGPVDTQPSPLERPLPGTPKAPGSRIGAADSPVRLTGYQDAHLNRALWLVKWLLALPHLAILVALWLVFVVLTVVAFGAILVTGRYPRSIFDLNVGILRWSWRVHFYATGALGTDRYPPFSLASRDYPADLDVAYPPRLSRGLVLVKSWLLALPHLVVVAVLAGTWGWTIGDDGARLTVSGLIGALTLAAGLLLLFTGRYPTSLFDLIVGLNRWVYRVITYVALMTDQYPPFRLDQGPTEPGDAPPPTAPGPSLEGGAATPPAASPEEPAATSQTLR